MMRMTLAAGFAVAALLAATGQAAIAASGAEEGLWDTGTQGNARQETLITDCGEGGGPRSVDDNGFCWIDDSGAVELGVKFTTSEPVAIGGIRVYRVDPGAVTGTLWSTNGDKLASGAFSGSTSHSWQDLEFATPVDIMPDQSYVASYFSPNSDYAYEWGYFDGIARSVGPLTATASVEGDRNGVFCYGTSCGLPTESYKDTNYWVTPLLWKHNFGGYQQPIDTAVVNTVKAGRAIPVKFSLGGDKGLDIVRAGHPKVTEVACEAGVVTDPVEETVTSDLNTLKYNASADTYTYVWKTKKSWSGSCVEFELGLNDWSSHVFTVKFA